MTKILISTIEKVYLWDGKPTVLLEGDRSKGNANHHGISWDKENIFVACSIDFRYCIAVYDRNFKRVDVLYDDFHQIHQILWNEKLYVTNTGKNRIDIWDGKWSHHYWNPSPCDIDHVNGIWKENDIIYVTEYRPKRDAVVRICNEQFKNTEVIVFKDQSIHNVYVENGKLYSCVADPKSLAIVDMKTKEHKRIKLEGHEKNLVRGLARDEDHWYVGMSQWVNFRGDRCTGDSIIAILDNDFKEVDRILIKDGSPVCDIRLLEGDKAHNGINVSA